VGKNLKKYLKKKLLPSLFDRWNLPNTVKTEDPKEFMATARTNSRFVQYVLNKQRIRDWIVGEQALLSILLAYRRA
jgi:hypothetical protein